MKAQSNVTIGHYILGKSSARLSVYAIVSEDSTRIAFQVSI